MGYEKLVRFDYGVSGLGVARDDATDRGEGHCGSYNLWAVVFFASCACGWVLSRVKFCSGGLEAVSCMRFNREGEVISLKN